MPVIIDSKENVELGKFSLQKACLLVGLINAHVPTSSLIEYYRCNVRY